MALHKGKPSGNNRLLTKGTGIPSNYTPENEERNNYFTRKYTRDDEQVVAGLKMQHPNRKRKI